MRNVIAGSLRMQHSPTGRAVQSKHPLHQHIATSRDPQCSERVLTLTDGRPCLPDTSRMSTGAVPLMNPMGRGSQGGIHLGTYKQQHTQPSGH
jgi:hypothetical protein